METSLIVRAAISCSSMRPGIATTCYHLISTNPHLLRPDNATHMIVFRTKNESVLKKMAEEMSDLVSEETFRDVYASAMEGDPHNFLFVDMAPKDPTRRFRKNFDTFLIPPNTDGQGEGKGARPAKRSRS